MKRFQFKRLAQIGAASAVFFAASSAFAIGPDYQYVPDAAAGGAVGANNGTLNDVCCLRGPGGSVGTGTVIGAVTNIPFNGTQMLTELSILTAFHVANGVNMVQFGSGYTAGQANPTDTAAGAFTLAPGTANIYALTAGLNPSFQTYVLPNAPFINGVNGPRYTEDVSIMQAIIPQTVANAAALGIITAPANIPTLANALNMAAVNASAVSVTQSGYGRAGVVQNAAGTIYTSYSATLAQPNGSGYRRFQNNSVNSFSPAGYVVPSPPAAAPIAGSRYFEPLVGYNTLTASVAAGAAGATGTGFSGDSGSPLFTSSAGSAVMDTPNWGPAAQQKSTSLTVGLTNNDSAVYVGLSPLNTVTSTGTSFTKYAANSSPNANTTINFSVPLLTGAQAGVPAGQGSLDWANQYSSMGNYSSAIYGPVGTPAGPAAIPEPGTLSLIAVGSFAILRRRARR